MDWTVQSAEALANLTISAKGHACAAVTVLLFDWMATFQEEVELVWLSPNTLPKFLYFVSRYLGMITLLFQLSGMLPLDCKKYLILQLTTLTILILCVELSMVLRLSALYQKNTSIRWILCLSFLGQATSMIALIFLTYPSVISRVHVYPPGFPFSGCYGPNVPAFDKGCWIPPLAFEALLFGLNTAKCLSYGPTKDTPLIYRLLRDGSLYFITVFIGMAVCSLGPFLSMPRLALLGSIWVFAIYSFSGARLLLSIRALVKDRDRHNLLCPTIPSGLPDISSQADDIAPLDTIVNGQHDSPTEAHELMPRPANTSTQNGSSRRSEVAGSTRPSGVTTWADEWNA